MKIYSAEEILARRPLDEAAQKRIETYADQMRTQVRAHRLAELRMAQHLTQVELANQLQVSQHRVSQIERGGTLTTQVDTLRRYVEALGGKLSVHADFDDKSYVIA